MVICIKELLWDLLLAQRNLIFTLFVSRVHAYSSLAEQNGLLQQQEIFFQWNIPINIWILAWCFFSHYWKELKCLISCVCLQRLTLYRTSVIWLVFITIHVEAMMNCCFNVFIRLHRYVLWASTHLSSKDYLDGLIDQIQHNGMCQSTSEPFLNISPLLMWLQRMLHNECIIATISPDYIDILTESLCVY